MLQVADMAAEQAVDCRWLVVDYRWQVAFSDIGVHSLEQGFEVANDFQRFQPVLAAWCIRDLGL